MLIKCLIEHGSWENFEGYKKIGVYASNNMIIEIIEIE